MRVLSYEDDRLFNGIAYQEWKLFHVMEKDQGLRKHTHTNIYTEKNF